MHGLNWLGNPPDKPIPMSDSQGPGFSIQGALEIIEELKGSAWEPLPHEQIYIAIGTIIKASARQGLYQCYQMQSDLQIIRARPLDSPGEWFKHKDDLGPLRPKKVTTYQRCHRPGRSVGYCSLYEDTALAEIRAKVGQQYAIATFELPAGSIVLPVGEFDFFRRTGGTYLGEAIEKSARVYRDLLKREDSLPLALFDAFFADVFMRPANSEKDYRVTSAIAEVVFYGGLQLTEPVEAILYPSVAFRSGTNFAVRAEAFSSRLNLVPYETRIIEIVDDLGYGIYDYRDLKKLKSVGSTGELAWENV